MNNRDYGLWLIPLLAVLTISSPISSGKQPIAIPSSSLTNVEESQSSKTTRSESKYNVVSLIRKYFADDRGDHPLHTLPIEFLIATVPDPKDSSLAYLFDRHLAAIQRALETAGYVLDRFELPWAEKDDGEATKVANLVIDRLEIVKPAKSENKVVSNLRLHERAPGIVLFRHGESGKLLVIFLIGETPTSGVHKNALTEALNQMAPFCREDSLTFDCKHFRILGPTFSGSTESIVNAVKMWDDRHPNSIFTLISGSATSINKMDFEERFKKIGNITACFDSTLALDTRRLEAFEQFLEENRIRPREVAILTEGNTAFGASLRAALLIQQKKQKQQERQEPMLSLTYPLHISQLRVAAEKAKDSPKGVAFEAVLTGPKNLRLSLEEAANAKDVMTNMSQFETFSTELVLSGLLGTISREAIRYVGILATDIRDQIFLVREIRRRAPNAVLFTFGTDLLYLHSDVNLDFQGMLIFTSYPLFSMNQVWTDKERGKAVRFQFPDESSQGVYNAILQLLDGPNARGMLEHKFPFGMEGDGPPLWLSVVGNKDLWPIKILNHKGSLNDLDTGEITGFYSKPMIWAIFVFGLLFIVPMLSLVKVFFPRDWMGFCPQQTWERKVPPWLQMFADAVFEKNSANRRIYLLCLAVALSMLGFIGTSIFARSLRFSLWNRETFLWSLLLFIILALVVQVFGSLLMLEKDGGGRRSLQRLKKEFPHVFLGVVTFTYGSLAMVVIAAWLSYRSGYSLAWFFWGVAFVVFLCLTISALMATVLIIRQAWRTLGSEFQFTAERVCSVIVIFLGTAFIFVLAFRQSVHVMTMDLANQLIYHLRTVNAGSGLSPLLPLLFVAGAGTLWNLCSLRRLRMLEELSGQNGNVAAPLVHVGTKQAGAILKLENDITCLLTCRFLRLPGKYAIVLLVGVPCFLLFVWSLVPSIESRAFYRFFGWFFTVVYLAIAFMFLRFICVWWQTHRLLRYLAAHPLCGIYGELAKGDQMMPKMDLSAAFVPYTALRFALNKAVGCLPPAEIAEIERLLEDSAKADSVGDWQLALKGRNEALNRLVRGVGFVEGEIGLLGGLGEEGRKRAQEFFAAHTVVFIHHILSHLQNLILFVVSGLLLMLLAINYYPFQPREWLLWFNWLIILTTVSVSVVVFVQIGRDKLLSLLSGTTPGQVTWNRDFILRILFYVVVPILALLGAQFPEGMRDLLSWIGTVRGTS